MLVPAGKTRRMPVLVMSVVVVPVVGLRCNAGWCVAGEPQSHHDRRGGCQEPVPRVLWHGRLPGARVGVHLIRGHKHHVRRSSRAQLQRSRRPQNMSVENVPVCTKPTRAYAALAAALCSFTYNDTTGAISLSAICTTAAMPAAASPSPRRAGST